MKTITRWKTLALLGMATIGGVLGSSGAAHAQGYGGDSMRVRPGGYESGYGRGDHAPSPYGRFYGGRPASVVPYPSRYTPYQPWSPGYEHGWRRGRYFFEAGILPDRPLSPAERDGFLAAQRSRRGGRYQPW